MAALCVTSGAVQAAVPQGYCAVIIKSVRTIEEAQSYIRSRQMLQEGRIYLSRTGWYGISTALLANRSGALETMSGYRDDGIIPADSFCADSERMAAAVDPESGELMLTVVDQMELFVASPLDGRLNLRSGPRITNPVLLELYDFDRVTFLGRSGNWYHVETETGVRGYAYGRYLFAAALPAIAATPSPAPVPIEPVEEPPQAAIEPQTPPAPTPIQEEPDPETGPAAFRKRVVYLECQMPDGKLRIGAGVLVGQRGHVVTAGHIVGGREARCFAQLGTAAIRADRRVLVRKLHAEYDVALLQLVAKFDEGTPAPLVGFNDALDFTEIVALGFPREGFAAQPRAGRLSSVIADANGMIDVDQLELEGMAGAPVLTPQGKLAGLVVASSLSASGEPIFLGVIAADILAQEFALR